MLARVKGFASRIGPPLAATATMLAGTALLLVVPAEVRAQNYSCAACIAANGCWWCRLGDGQAANCGTPQCNTCVLSGFCDGGSCDGSGECSPEGLLAGATLLAPETVANPGTRRDSSKVDVAPPERCTMGMAARSRDPLALTARRTRGVFELLR